MMDEETTPEERQKRADAQLWGALIAGIYSRNASESKRSTLLAAMEVFARWNGGGLKHLDVPSEPRRKGSETADDAIQRWVADVGRVESENAGNLLTLMWSAFTLGDDPTTLDAVRRMRSYLASRHGIYEISESALARDKLAMRCAHTGLLPTGKESDR